MCRCRKMNKIRVKTTEIVDLYFKSKAFNYFRQENCPKSHMWATNLIRLTLKYLSILPCCTCSKGWLFGIMIFFKKKSCTKQGRLWCFDFAVKRYYLAFSFGVWAILRTTFQEGERLRFRSRPRPKHETCLQAITCSKACTIPFEIYTSGGTASSRCHNF